MSATVSMSDAEIREMAEKRVQFRRHAAAYALVNVMLAAIWYFTSDGHGYYWPVWTHLGWGIGLGFHAYAAYMSTGDAVAREEEKLRKKYGK